MPVNEQVAERAEARVGKLLRGKWRLERVLGVGGMAVVYAATHRNQARVAIKMLHPEVALDQEVTERFLREGYLANTVDHRGTVKVLDDDVSEDGAPFLVMELLEGETLEARWVRKGRVLPVSEVLPIANQVLDVLAAAHEKGIVHRDLKPENLFLTRSGDLKILDFGIARLQELSQDTTQTRAGSVMGTPAFMSPEQARGRWDEVDARTDIWAVGATIFTLLTGRYVHEGTTVQEQLILAATQPAPSVASLVDGLSPAVIELVDRALAFDKHARWADPRAMQAALRAALETEGLVDRLTLPAPSSPGSEALTVVASPELLSGAISAPGSALTTRAVTNSTRNPQQGGRRGLFAVTAALVVLLGGATTWHLATRTPTQALPLPPAPAAPGQKPVEIGPLATAAPDPATPPAPPPSASSAPVLVKAPKPSAKPPRTGPDKPPDPAPGPTTSLTGNTPKSNPFDKRL
jgi:serine/threonine-protein kinase